MKAFLIGVALLVVLLIILSVSTYVYYGGFSKINVTEQYQNEEIIAYENVTGDYAQTREVTDKVYYQLLNDEKIQTTKGIGIFYDNPKHVDKAKLRSEVGCIIENLDDRSIAKLSNKYQIKMLPEGNYMVVEFPSKGFLSVIIGMIKVHPALEKYQQQHGYQESPVIEVYDVLNKKTVYKKQIIKK